ncbi:MAG: hypothetical protein JRI72_11770 [Deltaproteobacteria bacterium]|nr:hypothetical protein [Deltaproteobacteria bacterium]
MKCRYHPDREARVTCQKMGIGYCQECLDNCEACTDPCAYCKYKQSCIIWELCRKSEKRYRLERAATGEIKQES